MTNKKTVLVLVLICLMAGTLVAREAKMTQEVKVTHEAKATPEAKVTQLLSKDLTNLPGKEGLMITVDYPPGSSDPIHRHNAHAFVYVLEGSIVMQVRGGKETILTPGQTFYEGPDDVWRDGRRVEKQVRSTVTFYRPRPCPLVPRCEMRRCLEENSREAVCERDDRKRA